MLGVVSRNRLPASCDWGMSAWIKGKVTMRKIPLIFWKSVVLAVAAMMVVLPRAGAAGPAPSPEAHARAEFQKYATRLVGKPATTDAEGACTVEGTAAGDHRFRVQMTSGEIETPVIKEESTRVYAD